MSDYIQNTIFKLHDFIGTLNFGMVVIISISAIIFTINMLYSIIINKDFQQKTQIHKFLFMITLVISVIFIVYIIFAGDIYLNLSAEEETRYFAERLCYGEFQEIYTNDSYLTPEYKDIFPIEINKKLSIFKDGKLQCDADMFFLIESHFYRGDLGTPDSCLIVLKSTDIINIQNGIENSIHYDYYYKIKLKKVLFYSRFIGPYLRWRINDFSFIVSEPYTFKEWHDRISSE